MIKSKFLNKIFKDLQNMVPLPFIFFKRIKFYKIGHIFHYYCAFSQDFFLSGMPCFSFLPTLFSVQILSACFLGPVQKLFLLCSFHWPLLSHLFTSCAWHRIPHILPSAIDVKTCISFTWLWVFWWHVFHNINLPTYMQYFSFSIHLNVCDH